VSGLPDGVVFVVVVFVVVVFVVVAFVVVAVVFFAVVVVVAVAVIPLLWRGVAERRRGGLFCRCFGLCCSCRNSPPVEGELCGE
jgi:hypothetical protein